jgi:hypothetical protein
MRTLLKSTLLPLVALWLLSPLSASAWTWDNNCEGGAVGALLSTTQLTGFTDPFSLTSYSNAQAATGSESCKMGITSGSDGWGIWGGTITFPATVPNGGQVWARVSLFVPSGFNVTTNDGVLKFMRIHTATSGNANVGYHDLLITNPGSTQYNAAGKGFASAYVYNYEGDPNLNGVGTAAANGIVQGKWETYEMYVKFDTVPKASGGTGEVRIWKNNSLLLDVTSQPTLVNTSDHSDGFFLFTYWNGNAPATQSVYTDDIIVTSDTPSNKDSAGNACLCGPNPGGSSTSTGSSAPTSPTTPDPPSNVSVQ